MARRLLVLVLPLLDRSVWGFLSQPAPSCSSCTIRRKCSRSRATRTLLQQSTPAVDDAATVTSRDLSGYSLWVTFQGFGVERMSFGIELKPKYEALFSRGIESSAPGFWRVATASDGRETLDVTHPVLPEYMFFFDLWEKTVVWSGRLNVAEARVEDGVVTTNKKRFGIFPYTETLATFEAELLAPGQKLPDVVLPQFNDLNFLPPDDFDTPFDMRNYPQHFSKEFINYFFAVEEALATGKEPPPRPKTFFVPDPQTAAVSTTPTEERINDLEAIRDTVTKKGGSGGKAFGKK